ncbi:MAG: YceI family protein [Deltaproteobacteria bacterium]
MKKILLLLAINITIGINLDAQKFITKNGIIKFRSDAKLEKIEAVNKQVNCAYDLSNNNIVFKVLIKSFEFEKALMQEHFNENYLESDKFPLATFSGTLSGFDKNNISKKGSYNVIVEGKLTIHGVTKQVKEKGSLEIKDGKITATSGFNIKLKDYNIKIPNAVFNKVAEEINITVEMPLSKV